MARTGKIASLPFAIREQVNQRILDGEPGSMILPWLNDLPEVRAVLAARFRGEDVNDQNLTNWRDGGYQDWLQRRDSVDRTRSLAEFSLRLAQAAGGDVVAGPAAIAGGRILERIETATDEELAVLIDSIATLRSSESRMMAARIAETEAARKERQLQLEEAKFQRTTAKLFLQWYEEEAARNIAASPETDEAKMDGLVELFFGKRPPELEP